MKGHAMAALLMTTHPSVRKVLRWMGRLGLVLGVLGGGLFLSGVLSPWAWFPGAVPPAPSITRQVLLTESAQHALIAGDLPLARGQIAEALVQAPLHAPALLLQACVALEEGDTEAAEAALARLESATPGRAEAELLQRLLAHRTQPPVLGWRDAFLRAWTELGRPSFLDSPLLLPETWGSSTRDPVPADAWERAPSEPVRLALVLARPTLPEKSARWLVAQLPALEDAALAQAASAALLQAELPPSLEAEARAAVRGRLSRLVAASPGVMQPRLLLLWAETSDVGTLGEPELEALEVIAAQPTWKSTSFTNAFLETRTNLKEAGIAHPGVAAFEAALWSTSFLAPYVLVKRAESTRSQLLPGARHRLGRVLWDMGSRLREQSTVLERMTGLQLMAAGAEDMGDGQERERVDGMMSEARAMFHAAAQAALERWPLPSLWEEAAEARARGEWDHLQDFAVAPSSTRGSAR